jgi:hypothetical protein
MISKLRAFEVWPQQKADKKDTMILEQFIETVGEK